MFKKSMKNSTKLTEWYLPSGRLTWRLLENTLCSIFFGNLHWRCTFGYVSFGRPGILLFVGKDSIRNPPMGQFMRRLKHKTDLLVFFWKDKPPTEIWNKLASQNINHNSLKVFLPKNGVNIKKKRFKPLKDTQLWNQNLSEGLFLPRVIESQSLHSHTRCKCIIHHTTRGQETAPIIDQPHAQIAAAMPGLFKKIHNFQIPTS